MKELRGGLWRPIIVLKNRLQNRLLIEKCKIEKKNEIIIIFKSMD